MRVMQRGRDLIRGFLTSEAAGGLTLMAAAGLALLLANSPLAEAYRDVRDAHIGTMSVLEWINDGLMSLFFLLVGLEIKRELIEGELSTWSSRILPGVCAAGGMAVPALIYLMIAGSDPATHRGWAIPVATDIAFALGVISLLGSRVPLSLKVFLTALAILDDLGAVIIIAVFYAHDLSAGHLALAAALFAGLIAMNIAGVKALFPYLLAGVALWWAVLGSGVHATLAGVLLALVVPIRGKATEAGKGPLHSLEHALQAPVAFIIVPLFGLANAGVSFAGVSPDILAEPVPAGIAIGLFAGKALGVFAAAALLILPGLVRKPQGASWLQLFGVCVLCGVGFTMSLFIGMLAFDAPALMDRVKLGVIMGSGLAGLTGFLLLYLARPRSAAGGGAG